MIEGSLANQFDELDKFVVEMKEKILLREEKHKHCNNNTDAVRKHLIEEILEMFKVNDSLNVRLIKRQFVLCDIDIDEAIDVAAMVWALKLSIKNDENKHD